MSAPRASTAGAAGFAGCGGGVGGGSSGPGGSVPGARGLTAGDWTRSGCGAPVTPGCVAAAAGAGVSGGTLLADARLDRAVIQGGGHPERADRRSPVARAFEGVGFALAAARVPEIGRRCLGHTEVRAAARDAFTDWRAARARSSTSARRSGSDASSTSPALMVSSASCGRPAASCRRAVARRVTSCCSCARRPLGDAAGWRGVW